MEKIDMNFKSKKHDIRENTLENKYWLLWFISHPNVSNLPQDIKIIYNHSFLKKMKCNV